MMGVSPLARLSSIDLMEPPSESLEIRAATPSELDYSQLGNLGHGTLQVVNGCPSPVPSMASPGRADNRVVSDEHENYFTASERGDDSRPTSKQAPSMPQNAWLPPTTMDTQSRGRGKVLDYDLQTRGKSPLKQEVRIASLEAFQDNDAESVYSKQLRPASSMDSLHTQSKRRFSFEETPEPSLPAIIPPRLRGVSQSADSLAKDYEAELPPSPHTVVERNEREIRPASLPRLEDVVRRPMSSGLRGTLPGVSLTKQAPTLPIVSLTKLEPTPPNVPLLEDVVRRPMSSVNDIWAQTVVIRPTTGRESAPISPRRPLDSHPTPSRSPPKLPNISQQTQRRPVGMKADSGYGSNGSARDSTSDNVSPVEGKPNLATVGYVTALPPVPGQGQRFYSSERKGPASLSIRIGQIASKTIEATPAADAGAKDDIVESIEKDLSPQEKMKRSKSWRKSFRKSLPRLISAESSAGDFSKSTSAISDTTTSSDQKSKKLQKRRPLSQPPINLADRHVLASGGVPRVPSTVFSRYSTRLSESPAMQHLEQTYDHGLDTRESSFEPSSAVASKGSLPSYFFPDADLPDELPTPPAHRRMSWGRKSFRRSRSRSKSYVDETEVLSTGISDFGTTAQSLGTSPYDVAMPPMPRRSSAGAATQPHHLGMRDTWSGAPREGWDDQTAARIAQTRSRERASQLHDEQQLEESMQRFGRTQMPPRAQSYHPGMPVLEVYTPAPKVPAPRPQSLHANNVYDGPSRGQDFDIESTQNDFRRSVSRPRTPHAQARDVSPVKNLVSAYEHRASNNITALPPMPTVPTTKLPEWSDPSRVWCERRRNAAQTASPDPAQQRGPNPPIQTHTMSVTTTTVSNNIGTKTVGGPQRPSLQMNRKSMPQMRQVYGPVSHTTTTTTYAGNRASYVNTVSGAYRDAPSGTTTTTRKLYGIDFGDVPMRVI